MIRELLLCAALAAAPLVRALPGDLDASYGSGGSVPFQLLPGDDRFGASVVQPDGKIVSAGTSVAGSASGNGRADVSLTRHLQDGTLDPAFGSGGRVLIRAHPQAAALSVTAVGIQPPTGKIVVAVRCLSQAAGENMCVARFMPDGTLDPTFEAAGWSRLIADRYTGAMAVRPDGRLLFFRQLTSGASALELTQLTADGTLDNSFGTGGISRSDFTYDSVSGAVLQPDGKVLVVGRRGSGSFVARFISGGPLDTAFGLSGSGVAPQPEGLANAIALQPDGRIVIAGCTSSSRVARLDSAGGLDPTFGSGGVAALPSDAACPEEIAVGPDGRVVTAGAVPAGVGFTVLTPAGALDASFGTGGRVGVPATGAAAPFRGLGIRDDGAILTGFAPAGDFGLVRVLGNGVPDGSFGTNGVVVTDLLVPRGGPVTTAQLMPDGRILATVGGQLVRLLPGGSVDPGLAPAPGGLGVAIQADGKLLVAGSTLQHRMGVFRYNADGSLDTTWGTGGFQPVAIPGFSDFTFPVLVAIATLPDGKVGLAGTGRPTSAFSSFLARLNADGSLDASFGDSGVRTIEVALDSNKLEALRVEPDGHWLSAGAGRNSGADRTILARTTAGGAYDPDFGFNGRALAPAYPIANVELTETQIVRRADGSIALVQTATVNVGPNSVPSPCFSGFKVFYAKSFTIASFDSQGTAEASFGTHGRLVNLDGLDTVVTSAGADSSGRVLISGLRRLSASGCSFRGFVARFTRQGELDTSFGDAGIRDLPGTAAADKLVVMPDDAIVALARLDDFDRPHATFRILGGGPSGPAGDADNDSIPDVVEASVGRDRTIKDNDVFADARLFAMQQYRDFLGREGDAAGVDYWTNQLATGAQTRAQMAETFFTSPEFQGTGAPMVRLYFAYFLRIPDYGGLQYWMGRFRAGEPLDSISGLFAASPEFVATYGALDNAGFVDRVYRNVLGRAADPEGLAYWKARLDGGMTRGQMMAQFSESPEYRGLIANEVYVTMMYVGMLRREPDPGGFSYWVGYMDAGNSGLALTGAFVAAPEYRSRFLP